MELISLKYESESVDPVLGKKKQRGIWVGKSSETKPDNALEGSGLLCYDTGARFVSDASSNWYEQ